MYFYEYAQLQSFIYKKAYVHRNRIQRKKKGVVEPKAKMSNIHSVIRCKHKECKLCSIVEIPFTNVL